ncbi:hypothetical protein [Raineya sp.]|jgi:predicted nuclease with RNAse H fold
MLVGLDFGAKLAGTTAIAWVENNHISVLQTQKKQDADIFLQKWIAKHTPQIIAIDAPLSLPKIYSDTEAEPDFFYRKADKILKAMSPLFLGGLTARAMQLKFQIFQQYTPIVLEVYPAVLAQKWKLYELNYKQDLQAIKQVSERIQQELPFALPVLESWHQVDAVLAFCSAFRYQQGVAECFGNPQEGLIWI